MLGSKLYINNSTFQLIESLVIEKEVGTELYVKNSTIKDIGFHNLRRPTDIPSELTFKVLDKNFTAAPPDLQVDGHDGFLDAQEGYSELIDCNFNTSVTVTGIVRVTSHENFMVLNSTFERIVGQEQSAVFFGIQNHGGNIWVLKSIFRDNIAKSSLISLTFAGIEIFNSSFLGNYAEVSSNGLELIFSSATVVNSTISNERNVHNITSDWNTVTTGFFNLNYQSKLDMSGSVIKKVSGSKASVVYAT